MAEVVIKGENHRHEPDYQELVEASESGEYGSIFVEDREQMTEDSGSGFFFSTLYHSTQFFAWLMKIVQHVGDEENGDRYGWKAVDAPFHLLHERTSLTEKLMLYFWSILSATGIFILLTTHLFSSVYWIPIAALTIPLWYFVWFAVRITWPREEYMKEQILKQLEQGDEKIYVQIGQGHLTALTQMLERNGVTVEPRTTNSMWRYPLMFFTVFLRLFTPIKSIRKVYTYWL